MSGGRDHLLALGFGYCARRLGARLGPRGWRVSGTHRRRRSPGRVASPEAGPGIVDGVVFDGAGPSEGVRQALTTATHLLVSIPPDDAGDPVLRHHAEDLLAAGALKWIGLFSTTGVYGDRDGDWVDESTRPDPGPRRSVRRLDAEEAWGALAKRRGCPLQIFRLSGIYGPGRSAFDTLRSGTARRIVKPGTVFNRIHVDDVAGAVAAGMARPEATGPVNVSDDEPASSHEVLTWAARRLGVEPPPEVAFDAADLSTMARSFYAQNRRVANARLKEVLGYALLHPTYREGLEAILAEEGPAAGEGRPG